MEGKKVYLQPMDTVLLAVHDLIELQKGRTITCDGVYGMVRFQVSMYETVWEYHVAVTDIGRNRCGVAIHMPGETLDKERLIGHEFALLDYVLIDRAKVDFEEIEKEDRRIIKSRNCHQ